MIRQINGVDGDEISDDLGRTFSYIFIITSREYNEGIISHKRKNLKRAVKKHPRKRHVVYIFKKKNKIK